MRYGAETPVMITPVTYQQSTIHALWKRTLRSDVTAKFELNSSRKFIRWQLFPSEVILSFDNTGDI